ncbi:L-threonylcarbamoyladenylate synthase [candidate division KSB1 bacterium]
MARIIPVYPDRPDIEIVETAVKALSLGELLIYPAETLYGLGVDCENTAAVERLFLFKKRDASKPVPVIASGPEMVWRYAEKPSAAGMKLIDAFWPGPLTLVFKAKSAVHACLTGNTGTIGIRVPDILLPRKLAEYLGKGITATSANYSGEQPAWTIWDVPARLRKAAMLILHGGILSGAAPSTVVSVIEERPVIIREGAVPLESITKCLGVD